MKRKKWVEWYHEGVQIVAFPDENDAGIGSFFLHHEQDADPVFIERLSHQLMRNANCIYDDDEPKRAVIVTTGYWRWVWNTEDGMMRLNDTVKGRGAFFGSYVYLPTPHYADYYTVESYAGPMPELGWHADRVGRGWIALMDSTPFQE